ncbi:hypothetical protein I7I48_02774 [Histoplasma ohiense]|nr:hypothetical protein I7I48_02774 [Histoplasma ohiense (nom. inval.)]
MSLQHYLQLPVNRLGIQNMKQTAKGIRRMMMKRRRKRRRKRRNQMNQRKRTTTTIYPFKVRLPEELDLTQFDAVWTSEDGYPGDVPEELKDYLECGAQMIGSIRSIFWLDGVQEMVDAIDDPAFVIEDEIAQCPLGCLPSAFLLGRYAEEGKVPQNVFDKYMAGIERPPEDRVQVWVARDFEIPQQITGDLQQHRIANMYPFTRPRFFPETVRALRIKHDKKKERFLATCHRKFDDNFLTREDILFRGLSRTAVAASLALLVPTICNNAYDNEVGPGIYTTPILEAAKSYAGVNGAVMVFEINLEDLNVWEPSQDEWNRLTATWLQLPTTQGYSDSRKFPRC